MAGCPGAPALALPCLPVFCPILCSSSGYLVSRCISVGIMSFSCRRRHRGRLSASWGCRVIVQLKLPLGEGVTSPWLLSQDQAMVRGGKGVHLHEGTEPRFLALFGFELL